MFPASTTPLQAFLKMVAGTWVFDGARYLAFAGVAWLLGYVLFKQRWLRRKIIQRHPRAAEVWREIGHSAVTLVIFGVVGAATVFAMKHGWTQIYLNIGKYGWGWFVLSIV